MQRLGAVLALFGFGSAVLHFTDIQFQLLMWAEKWQPALGLIMGGVGALLLLIVTLRGKDEAPVEQGGQQAPFWDPSYQQPAAPGYGPGPGYPGGPGQPAQFGHPANFGGPALGQPAPFSGPPQQFGGPPQYGPPQGAPPQGFRPQGGPPFGPQGR